ncbi:MAG: hypothetical protein P1V51_11940 [Deltaproteobacteria bacterium]|nr:hypothetical protein [Deltaproteobacteria bacterium]
MSSRKLSSLLFALLLSGTACLSPGESPEGIGRTLQTLGPKVTWDLDAKPLPEIPFPNDIATRLDPTSPTGRRVNISLDAPTRFERELREKAADLTGFAGFSPITVGFDQPLDLCNIARKHHFDDDLTNDVAYIINVTEGPDFGEIVPIDMSRGFFPTLLEDRNDYFDGDPGTGTNLLLADHPYPPAACPELFEYDLNTFYEHETNTLLLQPMYPLQQKATHAIVLTRNLIGENGHVIQSPFEWVNHVRQTAALSALEDAVAAGHLPDGTVVDIGLELDDIAFAWTLTTQDASGDLLDIRRGLYGHGPFAALADEYPIDAETVQFMQLARDFAPPGESPVILKMEKLLDTLGDVLGPLLEGTADVGPLLETLDNIDYMVSGKVKVPYFMGDRDGIRTEDSPGCREPRGDGWNCVRGIMGDEDESFDVNQHTGEMVQEPAEAHFWCFVPKQHLNKNPGQPFPVINYSHGYSSARVEALAFGGTQAGFGLATCTVAAHAHGVGLDNPLPGLIWSLFDESDLAPVWEDLAPDKARDLNNDGVPDVGGDFFTSDAFHTRDVVRQTVVYHLMVMKMLRSFDGRMGPDVSGDGQPDVLGDFDGDGKPDLGGPDNDYFAWGTSMGGLHSSIVAAVEPAITAAAPNAGAAGLFDVAVRSSLGAVVDAVWLPLMGPVFHGRLEGDGTFSLQTIVSDVNKDAKIPIAVRTGVEIGDEILLENLTNGETDIGVVREDGHFRRSLPCDAVSGWEKRAAMGFDVLDVESEDYGKDPLPIVEDGTRFGDALRIRGCVGPCVFDEAGNLTNERFVVDQFEEGVDKPHADADGSVVGVKFQGTIYPNGSPLAAVSEGFGHERQSPDLRRLRIIAGFIQEPGDPVAYSRYYLKEKDKMEARWAGAEPDVEFGTRVMTVVTLGDTTVPVNGGVMLNWTSGFFGTYAEGLPKLRWLRDNYVLEAVEEYRAYHWGGRVLFDPDNLSNGTDGFQVDGVPAPRPPPGEELRLTYSPPGEEGVYGMRIPAVEPRGAHVFLVPDPSLPFDVNRYMVTAIGAYFDSRGTRIRDEMCMHDDTCDWVPWNQ